MPCKKLTKRDNRKPDLAWRDPATGESHAMFALAENEWIEAGGMTSYGPGLFTIYQHRNGVQVWEGYINDAGFWAWMARILELGLQQVGMELTAPKRPVDSDME